MIIMKKRQILIVALSMVVVIAAYLNWTYSEPTLETASVDKDGNETKIYGEATLVDGETGEAAAVSSSVQTDYFSSARITRDKARSDSLDILREVAESDNASEDDKNNAYTKMASAAENTEREGNVENLLKAKGFEDAIVYITDDSVSVTVKTEGLTAADSAKIYDIIVSETGVSADKIKIIEIK